MVVLAATTARRGLELNRSNFDAIKDLGAAVSRVLEENVVTLRADDVPGMAAKGEEIRVSWGLAVIAE